MYQSLAKENMQRTKIVFHVELKLETEKKLEWNMGMMSL